MTRRHGASAAGVLPNAIRSAPALAAARRDRASAAGLRATTLACVARRGGRALALLGAIAVACFVPGVTAAAGAPGSAGGATPILGGGGFADAPLVGAGVYSDTLLPRETLFYAVSMRPGERLRVRATADVSVGSRSVQEIPDAAAAFPTLSLFTPLRQRVPSEDLSVQEAGEDFESVEVEIESPRVLTATAAGARAERNELWTGPGIYHLAITLSEVTSALGATVEFPLRLAIEVAGRSGTAAPAAARASPGPLGDPRTGPEAAAGTVAEDGDGSASEPVSAGLLAVGAIGGILLGAAAGYMLAARRRRPA